MAEKKTLLVKNHVLGILGYNPSL